MLLTIKYLLARKRLLFLALIFLVSTNVIYSYSNKDSLKSKYELNDPRNPNCPCHKYQKLADIEYQKLLASNRKLSGVSTSSDVKFLKGKANSTNKKQMKYKIKRCSKFRLAWAKGKSNKRRKIHFSAKTLDACFSWK